MIMRNILLTFLVIISFNVKSQTIINTEKLISQEDSGFVFSSINNLSIESGNSSLQQIDGSLMFGFAGNKNVLRVFGNYKFLFNNNENLISRTAAQIRHNYLLKNEFRTFAFYQAQNNSSLILKRRQLFGGGLRRIFTLTDSLSLDFGSGVFYENEVLDSEKLSAGETQDCNTYRMANVLSLRFIKLKNISLINTVYFQPNIKDFSDFRFFNELSLGFKINEFMGLSIGFVYRYDSQPPMILKNEDFNFSTGISFSL